MTVLEPRPATMGNRLMSCVRHAVGGLALCCSVASLAGAQEPRVVRGVILDASDRPIGSATILSLSGTSAISDDSGRFRIEISHRNRIVLDVRRVGFMPSRLGLNAGGDTTVSVLLLPVTQRLPTVEVTNTKTRSPFLAAFDERMRDRKKGAGAGTFLTDQDIEKMNAMRVTQVVETIPSIFVRRVSGDHYAIFGRAAVGGSECAATVFLDGIHIRGQAEHTVDRRGKIVSTGREGTVSLDEYVQTTDVAGIEVYQRAVFAPSLLQPINDDRAMKCAVVAVWTKHHG